MILTGYTLSPDFPNAGRVQRNPLGNTDVFVSHRESERSAAFPGLLHLLLRLAWGSCYDREARSRRQIYFTGYTLSPDLFTVGAPNPAGAAESISSSPESNRERAWPRRSDL